MDDPPIGMLRWIKGLIDRTPTLPTDDLVVEPVKPPPPPPDDLRADDLHGLPTYLPASRQRVVTEETAVTRALSEQIFERFRNSPDELPPFPGLAIQIFKLLQRPREEVDVNRLVQTLSREPATSALMLRVANSSRYGGARTIATVRDAVVRLGIAEVANLAVAAASKALFEAEKDTRAELEPLWAQRWRQALTTAFSASWLSMEMKIGQPQQAFLAGLLHDLGKSLGLRVIGQLAEDHRARFKADEPTIEFALECVHTDVGGEAAIRWGLPDFVIEVCQDHHSAEATGLPQLVRIASDVYDLRYNPLHRIGLAGQLLATAQALDIDQRRFATLVAQVATFALTADEIASSANAKSTA